MNSRRNNTTTPSMITLSVVVFAMMGCGDPSDDRPSDGSATDAGSVDMGESPLSAVWTSVQYSNANVYALDSLGRVSGWTRAGQPVDVQAPTLQYLPTRRGDGLCGVTDDGQRWCEVPRPTNPLGQVRLRTLDYHNEDPSSGRGYECGILRDEDAAACQWSRWFHVYRQASFVDIQVGQFENNEAVALDDEGRMWELNRQGEAILLSEGPYVSITMNRFPCGLGADNVVRCFQDHFGEVRDIGRLPGEFVNIWSERQVLYCGHRPNGEFLCYFSGRLEEPYLFGDSPPVKFSGEVAELSVGRPFVCAVLTDGALECHGEAGEVPENLPRFPPPSDD